MHGATGGGLKDTLDAHFPVTVPDIARVRNLYETLLRYSPEYEIEPCLAESWERNADATVWTFSLRRGVTFHDGRPFTADDVAASVLRMCDPEQPSAYALTISKIIDRESSGALDEHTYRMVLTSPYAVLDQTMANYTLGMVPADYDPDHPIGTGPFRYESFVPGQRSLFVRHTDHWERTADFEELVILDFADDAAKVNALLAGQVQSVDNLPRYLAGAIEEQGAHALVSESGGWTPFTIRVDQEPFSDVRVRQALRLVVDRQEMIDQAFSGFGRVANDLYAPFDPAYIGDELPQRVQDIDEAKSLLKQAGQEDLQVELVTSSGIGAGAVESANLFAQHARKAGIDVRVNKVDSSIFYGDQYLSWPFAQDFWETRMYLLQAEACALSDSPYNETHFSHPVFEQLIHDAQREVDDAKRRTLLQDAQRIEYEEGGLVVWGFKSHVDAYSDFVTGFEPVIEMPMSGFRFNRASPVDEA
ncbi:ABC transporter substrate-binding protein [Pseudoclavibacter chungangensis]|uniref:ABC transporter substrate-binding protein n=1 Tax=Pseudoclavibacter chungangensis TaxID=587635 RepID=A0A7J5BNU6_9MICO|nr:ABC transporter substrate-binding protein [Pseudoclavibacter chungangensis]